MPFIQSESYKDIDWTTLEILQIKEKILEYLKLSIGPDHTMYFIISQQLCFVTPKRSKTLNNTKRFQNFDIDQIF